MKSLGDIAEDEVAKFLQRDMGWQVLDRNLKSWVAEIDIIASEKDKGKTKIHFVEVKYRNRSKDDALAAISQTKLHKIKQGAAEWIRNHRSKDNYQIDVAAVCSKADGKMAIDLRQNVTG